MEYQQLSIFIFPENIKSAKCTGKLLAEQLWIIYGAFTTHGLRCTVPH